MTDSVSTPPDSCQPYPDPIPGILDFGSVNLFLGAPGVGKTAMLAEWCRRWRDGRPICGHATHTPTGIYFLAADRGWRTHQHWFTLAGFPEIAYYSLVDDASFDLAQFRSPHLAFLAALSRLAPCRGALILVDPASLFITGDANKGKDVALSMIRFSRLARAEQYTFLFSQHFGKQKADPQSNYARPQDRIAGSHAFAGFTDTQFYLTKEADESCHILGWTPHCAPEGEMKFERAANGLFVPFELYTEMDRYQTILKAVGYEPTERSAILEAAEKAQIPERTVNRILENLVEQRRIRRVGRGQYVRIKES